MFTVTCPSLPAVRARASGQQSDAQRPRSSAPASKRAGWEWKAAGLLGFIDFGHLEQIIIAKWDFFKDVIPTEHWLKQRMDELEKCRNFIARNRYSCPANSTKESPRWAFEAMEGRDAAAAQESRLRTLICKTASMQE
jgi:hypothetical protein